MIKTREPESMMCPTTGLIHKVMNLRKLWGVVCFSTCMVLASGIMTFGARVADAQSRLVTKNAQLEFAPLSPDQLMVPQNLLRLIHAREVQTELGLTAAQVETLEEQLREIDKDWWPSRIMQPDAQRRVVANCESRAMVAVESLVGTSGAKRLRQVELQSQGVRMLVRPEVSKFLRLDTKQTKALKELFQEVDKLERELSSGNGQPSTEKVRTLERLKNKEPGDALALLTKTQSAALRNELGDEMDTMKMRRIHAFAPELITSGDWANSKPITLESSRGKVVLLHFYAFQCSNCIANFPHYRRWHETLSDRGVQVIGIQTPELPAERKAENVIRAAKTDQLTFPILIDTETKNWDAWGNTVWPTVYVVDKRGYIRFWWRGELNWQGATGDKTIETLVDELLAEES